MAIQHVRIFSIRVKGDELTMSEDSYSACRPCRRRAIVETLFDTQGMLDMSALFVGLGAIYMAPRLLQPSVTWIVFGLYMSGVSGVLGFVQRAQLRYFNQRMVWLGAPEPPLDVYHDSAVTLAWLLRVLFGVQASFSAIWYHVVGAS